MHIFCGLAASELYIVSDPLHVYILWKNRNTAYGSAWVEITTWSGITFLDVIWGNFIDKSQGISHVCSN